VIYRDRTDPRGSTRGGYPQALDPHYFEGWVEGCLERIGEEDPEEEGLFRDLWEDETQREVVIESLTADCEVRKGRPPGL
jgi:hypothetical protein